MPFALTSLRPCAVAAVLAFAAAHSDSGAAQNLVLNGSFNAQPNPLVFWINSSEALAGWASDGANGSLGSAQLRYLPTGPAGEVIRGAVYFTGLTQCVSLPGAGTWALAAFARVPDTASPSSFAGIRWTFRANGPQCTGSATQSGTMSIPRSTTWAASSPSLIQIDPANWTVGSTIEIQLQVGDSSTQTVEALEAFIDEVSLEERSLFADGFEE